LNHIQVALVFILHHPVGTTPNYRENDSEWRNRNGLEGIVLSPTLATISAFYKCDWEKQIHQ